MKYLQDGRVKRVADITHDNPDHHGLACDKASGVGIRLVIQFGRSSQDLLPFLLRYIRTAGKNPGNRRLRNTRYGCDILRGIVLFQSCLGLGITL